MTLAEEAKIALRRLGAAPLKKFGQNFMVDSQELEAIARAVDPRPGETVLEIGPGLGFLTRLLLEKGASVVAVERDAAMVRHLEPYFAGKTFRVIPEDILHFDPRTVSAEPFRVVGNIPYNITSPILGWLIDHKAVVREAYLAVQWEVAKRLEAGPGGKDWGSLSVFLQMNADVTIVKKIMRDKFLPPPSVDSALVKITFLPKPRFAVKDEDAFFAMVRRSFQKRRKTLLNALREDGEGTFSVENLTKALENASIDSRRRPETLSLEDWARLADVLVPKPVRK